MAFNRRIPGKHDEQSGIHDARQLSRLASSLLRDSINAQPSEKTATASGFATWVFDHVNPNHKKSNLAVECVDRSTRRITLGKITHDEIERLHLWACDAEPDKLNSESWALIYADNPDSQGDQRIFEATRLQFEGNPFRCRPDVVIRDESSGEVIIVERKITGIQEDRLRQNGYANIRAQLWTYSWIDDWLDAPDVVLICDFWQIKTYRNGIKRPERITSVSPKWWRSDQRFHSECLELFEKYGGKFLER